MKLTKDTKLYVLSDGKFITLADIWMNEREQIFKNQETIEKIKKRLFTETGQTNYITAYDLRQILGESS